MADIEVKNEGSVVLLIPMSDRGKAWIDDNLQLEGWQWYGNAAAVEARYADAIVDGMQDDGLEVQGTTRVIPEESGITPEEEAEMVRRGQLPPMERRSSKAAGQALQPAAADVALSQALDSPQLQDPAKKPMRRSVPSELPGEAPTIWCPPAGGSGPPSYARGRRMGRRRATSA